MSGLGSIAALALSFVAAAIAQQTPSFEIADVHPSPPGSVWEQSAMREPVLWTRAGQVRGNRYEIRSATLVDLIGDAWQVDPVKVIGGPEWLDSARFDIVAKVPEGASTREAVAQMLQALLAERFHLKAHRDVRPFPAFVLKAGPRILMRTTEGGPDSGCKRESGAADPGVYCRNLTMADFAQALPQIAPDYFQNNKLFDQTQLNGAFDFTLRWTRRSKFAAGGNGGISLISALEKQLGLKLDFRDVAQPVVVIESIDRNPTANTRAVAEQLPVMPAAFEVAIIKPTSPGAGEKKLRMAPGGRLEIQAVTLKSLIKIAWDIEDLDAIDNEELLSGAPKFSEAERYDILATAPANASIDLDSMKLMLRALLVERFGLKTHIEIRQVSVLALTASKPRLTRAATRSRSGCLNAPALFESNSAVPMFSIQCRNVTMAQLAAKLQALAGFYVRYPSVDATGLKGGFDFTVNWSPPHLVEHSTTDPNGGISLVEALDKQFGLKLKPEKRSMPVLVIDRLNPAPTPN
jgi:uncharacterized protein (TIGR03435 family)